MSTSEEITKGKKNNINVKNPKINSETFSSLRSLKIRQNIIAVFLIVSLGLNFNLFQQTKADNNAAAIIEEYMNQIEDYTNQAEEYTDQAEEYMDQAGSFRGQAEEYMYQAQDYMNQAEWYSN
tara:strand:+ start:120 stop:488 length:369 start_codon:yes stop_codon:yes gene_type:complete